MSDQVEEPDFLTTIKELMRLTREGVLDWSVDHSPSVLDNLLDPAKPEPLPTYTARYDDLVFSIEDASPKVNSETPLRYPNKRSDNNINPGEEYILKIKDTNDSSTISSPPMKPIKDLVSVIKTVPKKDKLENINEKLSEI